MVLVWGLVWRGKSVGLESVGEVAKKSVYGAWLEGSQRLADGLRSKWDAGLVSRSVAGADSVVPADTGWVQFLTEAFHVVGHVGHRESGLNPLVPSLVIVKIDKCGCLQTGVFVCGKCHRRILCWLERDGKKWS